MPGKNLAEAGGLVESKAMGMPGVQQPAEWESQATIWTAWPSHADLWEANLEGARAAMAAMIRALAAAPRPEGWRPVDVAVAVRPGEPKDTARAALGDLRNVYFFELPFGDIWFRDTAPIFTRQADTGQLQAEVFRFNGWGGKYLLRGDTEVATRIVNQLELPTRRHGCILEGGAVESNGRGTLLTTRQCLLNRNREPTMGAADWERFLRDSLGAEQVVWIEEGLRHDHTDGHIDNIARFVRPDLVLVQEPAGEDDPQRDVLPAIWRQLEQARTVEGSRITTVPLPSPGRVAGADGTPMAASHLNFLMANGLVLMPSYAPDRAEAALAVLREVFADYTVQAIDCRALISGGGALHCTTQPLWART